MAVITTGAHPAALWPGVHAFFGANYNKHPKRYSKIFTEVDSEKAYEEDIVTTGFGLAQLKPQGQSIGYDDHSQEGTKRYTHDTWGLGYIVTMEERQDNLYKSKSFQRSKWLARSMAITKEINGANILNRGFDDTSYANGWDGNALFVTDHVTQGGTTSNVLSPAADLSEASLEDLVIQIRLMEDSRGLNIALTPRCLIIPVNLEFEAHRILKSTLQNDTANNATNALRSMNIIPEIVVNEYLTDTDAWFIKTDADTGLQLMNRMSLAFTQDNDFDNENAKAKAVERYVFGWSDWRGAFGSAGA
jgi:hypothetical protein